MAAEGQLEADVSQLEADLAQLKESALENRLHHKIRALASEALGVGRPRMLQGPLQETADEFADRVEDAWESGQITDRQNARIAATDFIMHARYRDRAPVWIAVEASIRVDAGDIHRARATADALRAVFDDDVMAVAVGYSIDPLDEERAKAAHVIYLEVSPPRPI